jgi:hypothetical protein
VRKIIIFPIPITSQRVDFNVTGKITALVFCIGLKCFDQHFMYRGREKLVRD